MRAGKPRPYMAVAAAAGFRRGPMTLIHISGYIFLGLVAGAFSGLIGVGGGVIIVPGLVFLFGLSQHLAQGTTLALLIPPIGLLAAWTYYTEGYVDIHVAALMCIGFFVGGLLGAKVANYLSNVALERVFGIAMLLISLKMIFAK
jgi:uncharacterized membrane protein YfcA